MIISSFNGLISYRNILIYDIATKHDHILYSFNTIKKIEISLFKDYSVILICDKDVNIKCILIDLNST